MRYPLNGGKTKKQNKLVDDHYMIILQNLKQIIGSLPSENAPVKFIIEQLHNFVYVINFGH